VGHLERSFHVVPISARSTPRGGLGLQLNHSGAAHVLNAAGVRTGSVESLHDGNVKVVQEIINYCQAVGASLVTIGSAAEYGLQNGCSLPEAAECHPTSGYARSKLQATELVRNAARDGVRATSLRVFNPVGFGVSAGTALNDLVSRVQQAQATGESVMLDNYDIQRDYVALSDVVRIIVNAMSGSFPPVLNVGTGVGTALIDVVSAIGTQLGVTVTEGRLDESRVACAVADITELARHTTVPEALTPHAIAQMVLEEASAGGEIL
jgi:nucleoside-diphosphate-sugar epimerase